MSGLRVIAGDLRGRVVPSPVDAGSRPLLARVRQWIKPAGKLFVTVPNMLSLHRRLGAEMGLVESPYATSERNRRFRQPGRFDHDSLRSLLERAGWRVEELSGFFLKPFPNQVMDQLKLTESLLTGLFRMGRKVPQLACQIYVEATPGRTAP